MTAVSSPSSLADWLVYQQSIHPTSIDLGLERVRSVAQRLGIGRIAKTVITVAGTNGKGSCVAILSAIQRAAGRRVGCYTSPHLLEYRERIQLPDGLVSDAQLVDVFTRIEAARGTTSLSFFEFGTLAALLCFAASELDVAILEVGLGGRLDAVNIIDADAVLISTIGLDHQDWLGTDLQQIGREKAGVLRAGQVAVYADQPAVNSVLLAAANAACRLKRPGQDYRYWRRTDDWYFRDHSHALQLPWPVAMQAPVQIHNLAACVALTLGLEPAFDHEAIARGVAGARIAGRLQQLSVLPEVWLDIAHNPQAAASLRDWLQSRPRRPTLALFGALRDKDVAAVAAALDGVIDQWLLVPLDPLSPRGLPIAELLQRMPTSAQCRTANTVQVGLETALSQASEQNARLLIFGSFVLAEQVLRWPGWAQHALTVSIASERQ